MRKDAIGVTRRDFAEAGVGAGVLLATGCGSLLAKPAELIRHTIPASGETIPAIGLGTNRYGVGQSAAARAPLKAALERFHQLGGTVIDTAPMYRSSESVLGDLIADLRIRNELFVATKVDKIGGRDQSQSQMQESLVKLKTDSVDLLQVHNLRGWRTSLPLLREWKQDGRIRYIGITTSQADQYDDVEQIMSTQELDFVQLNYSLQERSAAVRLMPLAADRGVAVMINRAFGGGRIFNKVGDKPLPQWAQEFDCASWAQFLLKYAISHPAATVAIPGMTKAQHVDDNLGAARGRLPNAEQRTKQEKFFDNL